MEQDTALTGSSRTTPLSASDTIKTLGLSLIAYAAAFAFEAGYCDWFEIPHDLIRLDVTRLLIVASAIFSVVFLLWGVVSLTFERARHLLLRDRKILLFFAPATIVAVFGASMFLFSWFAWWTLCFVAFAVLVLILQLLSLPRKAGSSIRERIGATKEAPRDDFANYLIQRFGYSWHIFAVGFFVLLCSAYFSGFGEARKQKTFYIIDGNPTLVVLRVYGDRAICAPFDRARHETHAEFFVRDISKGIDPPLHRAKLGHLSVAE